MGAGLGSLRYCLSSCKCVAGKFEKEMGSSGVIYVMGSLGGKSKQGMEGMTSVERRDAH